MGAAQIFRNGLAGAGARIGMMAVGFVLTPFIVHNLGLQTYGLYSVIGALAANLGLLDFGLSGAFVRFITHYVERKRPDAARQVVTFGVLFYVGFGLVLALPVLAATPWIVHAFRMPAAAVGHGIHVFHLLFALLVVSFVFGVPGAVVVGMQRMDLATRNNVAGYAVYAVAVVVFLKRGWGVDGVIAASYAQLVVSGALQYLTARRLFGPLWHSPFALDAEIVRGLFAFGGWTQLTAVLNIITLDVGRFVSALSVSVTSVSYFEIGGKLAFLSRSLPAYFLDALLPAATAADADGDEGRLTRMYRSGTFYSMLASFVIAGFLTAAAGPIVRVWMGEDYPVVTTVILWLSIGYAAASVSSAGATLFRASGLPRYEAFFMAASAVTNVVATALLAPHFGVAGVAAGTAIGWIAGTFAFLWLFHRFRRLPLWSTVGASALTLTVITVAAGAAIEMMLRLPWIHALFAQRLSGAIVLVLAGAVYLSLFALFSTLAGLLRFDEARLFERIRARGRTLAGGMAGR
jgi:O-antigen/teichoic acid export membrane protein